MTIHISKTNLILYILFILAGLFFVSQAYGKSIEGLFLFNPSAGTVPFQVDISKAGIVDNLNADRVDDLHAADLMAAGGGGVYTAWGITSCAPGWTTAYTGLAMTGLSAWFVNGYAGGSSTVCKQGGSLTTSNTVYKGLMWSTETNFYHGGTISCAVCVK